MMDEEKFNTELKNRIAEVFDNYEDTGADEGWALLRQKYPVKEKDRGLAWLWYAAAAVALLFVGVWFMQKPVINNNNQAVNPIKTSQHPANKTAGPVNSTITHNNTAPVLAKVDTGQQQQAIQPNNGTPQIAKLVTAKGDALQNTQPLKPQKATVPVNPPVQNYAVNQPQKNQPFNSFTNTVKADTAVVGSGAGIIAATKPIVKPTVTDTPAVSNTTQVMAAQPVALKANTEKAMMDLLNQKGPLKPADADKQKAGKKASISLYAATYFNYATGSDNQLNVGAGFTSDFKLSRKLKLSTGLAVGQNSLSYNNTDAPGRLQYAATANDAPATLSGAIAANPSTFNATKTNVTPVAKKYNASLIGLDIPINFKYQFSPKSDTYVLAGVSSGTYITETYKTTATTSLTTQESTTRNSFSSFDLAKTLNFSFGVGYPLGKANRLIVEPFIKYPLDGLGAQQLKFGAGGINLKLNFQSQKK